ncbi:uncharacterized protein CELE_C14C11.7 [Caenorhabditis elegans]|uniref:Uncharacterized protein n=1 Tax=Caenorhabditis elegans TaxID=6239 RepID=Q17981_CAEEL|nr:Uncharacterized protein CELE_C14C11.7 [Caenorhabditis elegans]CCD64501.1 Uncharacterized protein CELE_C14C11.7 [Caenorhabditis elegans]|eukprot:NP_504493.1 Uncharacterized protein CELE_C14C11.7 [Caenorhabditis elegans]
MDCQIGSRRCATWDEIEDAPQTKRLREDKVQENVPQQSVQPAPPPPAAQQAPAPAEQPKFYISAPIQGFTVNNQGGCRYLFF